MNCRTFLALLTLAAPATAQVAEPWSLTVDESRYFDGLQESLVDSSGALT